MAILLDANVLVALIVTDHVHHAPAENWLARTDEKFATCPITQASLVRLLVRQGQRAVDAQAVIAALEHVPLHEFWPDSLSFNDVRMDGLMGHRQVTDAYLAQLARTNRGRLATFDRGLAALHADVAELIEA